MCGIAGGFGFGGKEILDVAMLWNMVKAISHRGPDGYGYYRSSDGRIMFGHARLSINDLNGGAQPISNHSGMLWCVCNGELYEYAKHRKVLEEKGCRFVTNSDSELILHFYELYGEDLLHHLRGEFSFALYDASDRKGLIVRDRFGIKPLYYYECNEGLLFSSEIKSLMTHPVVPRELNREMVWHSLGAVSFPDATLFHGVKQVAPGTMLIVEQNSLRSRRYWDFEERRKATVQEVQALSDEAYMERADELLCDSVKIRLKADVDVGMYLSGGIDSGSIASYSKLFITQPMSCFTVGFEGRLDESQRAKTVADHLEFQWFDAQISDHHLAETLEKSIWHSEIPTPNAHGAAKNILSGLAKKHCKVVLTGEGADEILGGYAHFSHIHLLEELANAQTRTERKEIRSKLSGLIYARGAHDGLAMADNLSDEKSVRELLGSYPYVALRNRIYREKLRGVLSDEFMSDYAGLDSLKVLASKFDCNVFRLMSARDSTQYFGVMTDLPNYILNNLGDRQEMSNSVEGRVPFLDHHFAEFVAAAPWRLKQNPENGENKSLLRELIRRRGFVNATEPKKVFSAPSIRGLTLIGNSFLARRYLSRSSIESAGVFDFKKVNMLRGILAVVPQSLYIHGLLNNALMAILSVQILHDLFCINFSQSLERFTRSLEISQFKDMSKSAGVQMSLSEVV